MEQKTGVFDPDRYLPRELAAKLEASRAGGGMRGERRVITMLFCDVKGSTAAAEQLDPEEWTEIINGAFEHMIRPIYEYEGLLARLMGDAILAFFGAPIAHEDDPQRAVLAGLEIQQNIQPYIREVRDRYGIDFALRVGINTGLVVVGEVGSDLRMEYTAIGDAINLAARMEQTAAPGSVQLSEETYKLVAPFFEVEALGGIEVKGKSAPVNAFRALSVKETPGRLRGLEGFSSPLVGREAELSALDARLAALREGKGSILILLGEAGLGKSSLVAAARSRLEAGSVTWLEAQALSYTQSSSYFSWRQIIRQSIGAKENDPPDLVREKLRFACDYSALPGGDIPFLEAMLAVESQASLQEVMGVQGDALFQRITDAVRGYIGAAARGSPLAIVFDDLHWMDEASLTLLASLADLVEETPVLLACLARPEKDNPAWEFTLRIRQALPSSSRQLELSPFSSETTNALLDNLLGKQDLPLSLYNQINEKAEGNPFFVEEIIRSLVETGQIVRENGRCRVSGKQTVISLPRTLTGVLSARIDRLPEETREVLHLASVIGRSFDLSTLSAISSYRDRLEAHLRKLEEAGLVQLGASAPEAEFKFRHALTQEAAYNSILLKRRRELHARVGEFLEETYAGRLIEYAPVLAHHFYAARDARSLQYDAMAGENAMRLYANAEASIHFSRALEVALRSGPSPGQIQELHLKLGQALELGGRYDEALASYKRLESYGREHDLPSAQMTALMAKATVYSTYTSLHDPARSEQALIQALDLSRKTGDRAAQTRLNWNLMLTYLFSKRLEQALHHGELALGPARELEDREPLAFVLNDLCRLYVCLGKFEQAHVAIKEARELWETLDNRNMLADSYGSEAEAYLQEGNHAKALELTSLGLHLSEEIENLWGQAYNRMLMSFVYFDLGEIGRAIRLSEQAIVEGERAGLVASSTSHRAELGWFYGYYGAIERGLVLAEQALRLAEEKQPAFKALPQAVIVRLRLLQGETGPARDIAGDQPLEPIPIPYSRYTTLVRLANVELALALQDYERALALAEDLFAQVSPLTHIDLPGILRRKADALVGLGRPDEAHRTLAEACSRAKRFDSKHHLWEVLASLAALEASLGLATEAKAHREEARQVILEIADSLNEIGLRKSFLEQPRVRSLTR